MTDRTDNPWAPNAIREILSAVITAPDAREELHAKLDEIASSVKTRKWSPVPTEECPIRDFQWGGYCETDAQLRERLKREAASAPPTSTTPTGTTTLRPGDATCGVLRSSSLRFDELRDANIRRSPHFKNAKGETVNTDAYFTLGDHVAALVGEVGEAANIIKKIRRGDFGFDDVYKDETHEERGWIIATADNRGATTYWTGAHFDSASDWARDVDQAVRFCRMSDAARVVGWMPRNTRVEEHMWLGPRKVITVREALAKELADTQCYLDKAAIACGVDLGEATRAKFNEVSERVGSGVTL